MWKIASHTDAVEMDGDWVVLDGERYQVTKLNETGGFLWNLLKEGATLGMLIRSLMEAYEIDAAQAEKDITAFMQHLTHCGLVEHVA